MKQILKRARIAEILFLLGFVALTLWTHSNTAGLFHKQQTILFPHLEEATAERGIRVFPDPDVYAWLVYARQSLDQGVARLLHTDMDNPPGGRETHWSSLMVWSFIAAGKVRELLTGEPPFTALENAAFGLNAFWFFLTALVFYLICRGALGAFPTLVGLFLLLFLKEVFWTFHPGRPDHQTLYFLSALGGICALFRSGLGWVRTESVNEARDRLVPSSERKARFWFHVSAVFFALGMWTGATVQVPILIFTGLTVLAFVFMKPGYEFEDHQDGLTFVSRNWAFWGACGAAWTLLFYAIQYVPFGVAMRLEVIHPLYALAWLGGGYLLHAIYRGQISGWAQLVSSVRFWVALGVASLLPLAILFGPSHWHTLRDPIVVRFQSQTTEGKALIIAWGDMWLQNVWTNTFLLPLLLVLAPLIVSLFPVSRSKWTQLLFLWIMGLGFSFFTYFQARWLTHAVLLLVLMGVLGLSEILKHKGRLAFRYLFLGVMIVSLGLAGWTHFFQIKHEARVNSLYPGFVHDLYIKRFAQEVERRHPEENKVVLLEPTAGPAFHYFGGGQTVASLFWQNADGLKDYRDFVLATDWDEAREVARRRQIDYVMLWGNPDAIAFVYFLEVGQSFDSIPDDRIIFTLVSDRVGRLPSWLVPDYRMMARVTRPFPVPLPMPPPPVRIYRVEP